MAKTTFREFRDICFPPEIRARAGSEKWYGLWIRRVSVRITWILAKFPKISPNMITVFMIFWGVAGAALILLPGLWGVLAFFLALQFWTTLDSCDGELARYKQQFSNTGVFLDSLGHIIVHPMVFLAIGLKFYLISGNNNLYLILGILCAVLVSMYTAMFYSSDFYILSKGFERPKDAHKANIITIFAREIMGHIEISMIGSAVLLAYIWGGVKWDFLPLVFLWGYLIMLFLGILFTIKSGYSVLNKK